AGGSVFAKDAVHIPRGDRYAVEEGVARHAVVALHMIRRHTPFVPPKNLYSRPHHPGHESLRGELAVCVTRRRAARERDDELSTRGNRVLRGRDETCRGCVGERGGAGQHREISSHRPSALRLSRINGRRYSRRPFHFDSTTSLRSEERRVGKECRSRWSSYHEKKKENKNS